LEASCDCKDRDTDTHGYARIFLFDRFHKHGFGGAEKNIRVNP
jgi:hypothetical protein